MGKAKQQYIVTCTKGMLQTRTYKSQPATIDELVEYYSYTLATGASYSHEKGNKKINCKPTTIKSLLTNLNNASGNAAANGAGAYYTAEQV